MTREEKKHVMDHINMLNGRINRAKNAIRDMNFGRADVILSEPSPELKINIDE